MVRNNSKRQVDSGDDQEDDHSTGKTGGKKATGHKARKRNRSDKQEILDFKQLEEKVKKLERENKKLQKQASSSTTRSTQQNSRGKARVSSARHFDDDSEENDNNTVRLPGSSRNQQDGDSEFEEEDDGFDETHTSPFQSKGIVTTTQPLTRGKIPLRRVSDLQVVTTHPVTASSTTVATEDGTSSQTHPHSRGSSPNPGPGPNSSPSSSRSSSRAPNCPPSHHTSPPRSPSSGIEIEPDREGTAQHVASAQEGSDPNGRSRSQPSLHTAHEKQRGRSHNATPVSQPIERVISKVEYKNSVKPSVKAKPKESDYGGITSKIISQALVRYQVKVLTEDGFPDHETQQLWARTVFQESCKEYERTYNTDSEPINRIYRLIMNRASTCRGHVRDKVCAKIGETFDLKHDTSDEAGVQYNATRVEWLLEPTASRYCHEEYAANPRPRNLGQVPIISRVLHEISFNRGSTSTGVQYRPSFDPIPLPTIALLLTMIRYGLERWKTGRQSTSNLKVEFRETLYKEVYTDHLKRLDDWVKLDPVITTKIRADMYQKVLRLGGIDLSEQPPTGLSESDKQHALEDLAAYAERNNAPSFT